MNLYNYDPSVSEFKLEAGKGRVKNRDVRFHSAVVTGSAELDEASGTYYYPADRRAAPLIILLHGVGNLSVVPLRFLAGHFARAGFAGFILKLPIHTSRLPETTKSHYPFLTPEEWQRTYRIAVINVRQVIDWAERQDGIDPQRVAVVGISFGGFIAAITMGIDARIKAGAFIVSAGNAEKIGQLSRRAWGERRSVQEYVEIESLYQEYLKQVEQKGWQTIPAPLPSFLNDPLTYAASLRRRPVMMINARWDEIMPVTAVREFWAASGKPELVWLPATHAGIWLFYPAIRRRISRFMRKALMPAR